MSAAVASVTATLERITGFQLTAADALGLARFYEEAFDGEAGRLESLSADELRLLGVSGGGCRIALKLGAQWIELQMFERLGRRYPDHANATDLVFQHLAIVTSDAARAWGRARACGATAISRGGPVTLPPSPDGVTAIKFRDPEGHPLELIEFPKGSSAPWSGEGILGIDHSAISVVDVEVTKAFFVERGLRVGTPTLNEGPTQVALDGLDRAEVDVVPMLPAAKCPHLELLRYRVPQGRAISPLAANDMAATKIVWCADTDALITDPAGHLHLLRRERADPRLV